MFSKHKIALAVVDIAAIIAGFNIGFWYVFASGLLYETRPYPGYFYPSLFIVTVIFIIIFQLSGMYKYQSIANPIHQIQTILNAYIKVLAAFILLVFFMKTHHIADSRLTIGISFVSSFLIMVLIRSVIIPRVYFYLANRRILSKRTLIIGAGEHGQMVCRFNDLNPRSYFEIIGFCDDDPQKVGKIVCGKPVLGNSFELENIIAENRIKESIIAISNISMDAMLNVVDRCKNTGLTVHVVSDLYNRVNEKMEAEEYGGLRTFRLVGNALGIIRTYTKRLIDIVGSAVLLAIIAPSFLMIMWLIKRDSKGPLFYKSEVIGLNSKPFIAYKFRTMVDLNRDDTHISFMKNFIQGNVTNEFYVKNDDRVTKIGRFLRKYSLDELPQLINVFKGQMSLVGPRFCTVKEYQFYKAWHKRRFNVKPGITGLWQVRARSEISYDDMVSLDLYYIENQSFFFDFEILLRTISVVIFGKGSRIEKPKEMTLQERIALMTKAANNKEGL